MPEWWTYSLSDFLLFSPRTYYRLIERYNVAVWPAQPITLGLGLVVAALLRRPSVARSRAVAAILAALWAWVGWGFIASRYTTINWAAQYLAWLFAAEVVLLGWLGAVRARLHFGWSRGGPALLGALLFGFALALYPLLGPALGRGWRQAEVFGIAPDPTALATLGLLLTGKGSPRARWLLLAAPLVWCAIAGVTLWAMGSPEAWILLSSALLAVAFSARGRRAP